MSDWDLIVSLTAKFHNSFSVQLVESIEHGHVGVGLLSHLSHWNHGLKPLNVRNVLRLPPFVGGPTNYSLLVYQSQQECYLAQMSVKVQSSFEMRLRVDRIHCKPLWVVVLSDLRLLGA